MMWVDAIDCASLPCPANFVRAAVNINFMTMTLVSRGAAGVCVRRMPVHSLARPVSQVYSVFVFVFFCSGRHALV